MRIFIVCLLSWFIAQVIKVIINSIKCLIAKKKGTTADKVTIETLFKLGGMPSSHTATVIALAASIGLHSGWDSDVFAVSGVFAFIVMFDAIKVRLPVEKLTEAFNALKNIVYGKNTQDVKKVEGHTLPEIAGGFVVGFCTAYLMVRIFDIFSWEIFDFLTKI
ncbi:MAG: divergent PAP2 family protein [Clostridia bacterium]|nr:divergent PAP2 family protein [Clostridia bacterium]